MAKSTVPTRITITFDLPASSGFLSAKEVLQHVENHLRHLAGRGAAPTPGQTFEPSARIDRGTHDEPVQVIIAVEDNSPHRDAGLHFSEVMGMWTQRCTCGWSGSTPVSVERAERLLADHLDDIKEDS